ncbi:MotA/TolQ/ExbB proton channel family protein [Celeribacter indicus]|uniref:MotA/TolQ/ExbB proton channel n=1 Tax=Celeribacter indicus TaxID=1208324 RepID=A0A0B5DVP5_9RHOB|nr:MotA/TolQ/ExbB proton channel family protein [Celeribacter indicus]AJE45225.1 MotA/TolQ/ExbB proton channel [Celeribacter indicus]SDX45693.1 outer membrane transport energization protein ExbB [Celeribacter indicus]
MPFSETLAPILDFLEKGGISIWVIAALSVITLALILWKVWDLMLLGAWSNGRVVSRALQDWQNGRDREALERLSKRRTVRAKLTRTAIEAHGNTAFDDDAAAAETGRVAKSLLARARGGLRPLELIATIAPLLGLLGTVLGMISAFQALQDAGSRADPAMLAGGIWEALLTTAAGMAVAIPASMALTWFESVTDRLRLEFEDAATRVFLRPRRRDAEKLPLAAE